MQSEATESARNEFTFITVVAAWNKRDYDQVRRLHTPDYTIRFASGISKMTAGIMLTIDELIASFEEHVAAFPDFTLQCPHTLSKGDTLIGITTYDGTHQNTFQAVEPTFRPLRGFWASVVTYKDGLTHHTELYHSPYHILAEVGALDHMKLVF